METEYLKTFLQVIRDGSFSKAARVLNISQPTITGRIQALEKEVGGELFMRAGRFLQLTELGTHFQPYAEKTVDILALGVETTRLVKHGERGHLLLGVLQSLIHHPLTSTVMRYQDLYPAIHLSIRTGHTEQIVEMLYARQVQLGFISWPFFNPELVPLLLCHQPLLPVIHANHPLAKEKQITPRALGESNVPFLSLHWNNELDRWSSQFLLHTERILSLPISLAYNLVLQGVGFAFLPASSVQQDLAAQRLVQMNIKDIPSFTHETALVQLVQEKRESLANNNFIEILYEESLPYCQKVNSTRHHL